MKHQIIIIHGGSTFDTYKEYLTNLKKTEVSLDKLIRKRWKDTISEKLGKNFEVLKPMMPNGNNAKYLEWKIWFEKFLPLFSKEIVLVGHSLGGIFLAKYLAENTISKKIKALFLIAAPYDDKDLEDSLADFVLPKSLKNIEKQTKSIYIYHSKDDPVVAFIDAEKYTKALPSAHVCVFENREHFNQSELPELVQDIQKLFK